MQTTILEGFNQSLKKEQPIGDFPGSSTDFFTLYFLNYSKWCSTPNAIKHNWEVGPCWVLPSLPTVIVGFEKQSSLMGIRTKLTQETTLSKRRNIFLITAGIKCIGTHTHRSPFHYALVMLPGVKIEMKAYCTCTDIHLADYSLKL